jgi:hypothetical protein
MVKVELQTDTLSVLVAGLYCTLHNVDVVAIPESVYLSIAEKLEYFLPDWDYNKISFEDWVKYCLNIYPKEIYTDEELKFIQENTLSWEFPSGNAILVISMDIGVINER